MKMSYRLEMMVRISSLFEEFDARISYFASRI